VSDYVTTDDAVLLVWPRTTRPLHVSVGQHLEIILETESLQLVHALDPTKLARVAPFPCHIALLCGAPGVTTWAFIVESPGTTTLHIVYGSGCPPDRCLTGTIDKVVVISAVR
jgi:hypothetical protein